MAIGSLLGFLPSFKRASGPTLIDGGDLVNFYNFNLGNNGGLTAGAGGTVGVAVQLNTGFNRVTTVASSNDSSVLPPAVPGSQVWIKNYDSTNTLRIFANQTNGQNPDSNGKAQADNIVAHGATSTTASGTAVTIAAGHMTCFICTTIGLFDQVADWS